MQNRSCGSYEFKCKNDNGQWIYNPLLCNGFKQSQDGSDEDVNRLCKNCFI